MSPVVILGGGIAGVGAAYTLKQAGKEAVVYEAAPQAGGLLDNFTVEGFRFDNAVHLSFATEPEVRAIFDQTPYLTHKAESLCWDRGLWLRHPVQNNMHPLPVAEKIDLIAGLVEQPKLEITNYEDWLFYQYGEPIARRWPCVYTEKYWTMPASMMGTKWIGKRMRRADLREVLLGAMTPEVPNTYYVSEMRYPRQGGYRAFMTPLLEQINIQCGRQAIAVNLQQKIVHFADGKSEAFSHLISTIPLPSLIEMIDDAPHNIQEAAASLFATEIDLISIGFRRPDVSPSLWYYIYDQDIAAARAYSPSWKSPDNAPAGCSSLQFEIYSSRLRPQSKSPEELKQNCIAAILEMGSATSEDIIFAHHKHIPYANVVFDIGMEERRDLVREWLSRQGVMTAGRFGEWDYLWSNQALLSGMRAGQTIC